MPSFQITIRPSRRSAARFVGEVRRALLRALEQEKKGGLTQSEIARRLDVHRSVISREIRGQSDITLGRLGELAWAMGYKPAFRLEKVQSPVGANIAHQAPIRTESAITNSDVVMYRDSTQGNYRLPENKAVEIYEAA